MRNWLKLTEQRIKKAEAEGQLQGLAGEGKPLPHRLEQALVSTGDEVGYRIMAEAGALPEEIKLKKALDALRAALAGEELESARRGLMRQIADTEMRYNIAREARRKYMGGRGD